MNLWRLITPVVLVIGFTPFSGAIAHSYQSQYQPEVVLPESSQSDIQLDKNDRVQGEQWFDRMQQALRELNFDASFVHVRGQRIEPYRWLHGLTESGGEVEVLAGLNGPEYRALRHNDYVSYYHSVGSPYSMRSDVLNGPLPAGFYQPFERLRAAYNVVSVGGARVMDRPAQHIRIVARDRQRYGYSLWLDRDSGMLLRVATLSVAGDVLEQIQLTSLYISDELLDTLRELEEVPPPPLIEDHSNRRPVAGDWTISWLPQGFDLVRSNHHRMAMTGQPADYFLYSDGLAKVSVYISARVDGLNPVQIEGAESLFAADYGNIRVTVVGGLPVETMQRIAQSVSGSL